MSGAGCGTSSLGCLWRHRLTISGLKTGKTLCRPCYRLRTRTDGVFGSRHNPPGAGACNQGLLEHSAVIRLNLDRGRGLTDAYRSEVSYRELQLSKLASCSQVNSTLIASTRNISAHASRSRSSSGFGILLETKTDVSRAVTDALQGVKLPFTSRWRKPIGCRTHWGPARSSGRQQTRHFSSSSSSSSSSSPSSSSSASSTENGTWRQFLRRLDERRLRWLDRGRLQYQTLRAWLAHLPARTRAGIKTLMKRVWKEMFACIRQPSRLGMHYRNFRQTIRDFIHHFWTGTKLLAADARLSWRILKRMAQGKQLTRRERNILIGTGSDLARLVPFSFFIIVPFMEFALPLALKLFPNMIPSHFQDKKKKEEDLKRQLKARIELAKYLQDVVEEKARMIRSESSADQDVRELANELTEFLQKLREHQSVDQWDVLRFARLFKDEITLENATREQLIAMCRYMGIAPHGSDSFLRYRLRAKLASIKNDDMLIAWEGGVKNLTDEEVAQACRDRGIRTEGLPVEHQRMMLAEWIELSQNREIPGSLMILSRAFFYTMDSDKALQATLSSLPHEVVQEMQTSAEVGGRATDAASAAASAAERRSESERRLAEVRRQERLMELEEQNAAEREAAASSAPAFSADSDLHETSKAGSEPVEERGAPERLTADTAFRSETVPEAPRESQVAAAAAVQAAATEATTKPPSENLLRQHLQEMNVANRKEAVAMISAALEEMLNPIVSKERQEIEQLKLELAQAMASGAGSETTTPEVERLKRFIARLENECALVEQKVGDALKLLDRDNDGFISVKEIVDAIAELRFGQPLSAGRAAAGIRPPSLGTSIDPDSVVAEVLRRLDLDADGVIQPEDVRRLANQVAAERLGLSSRPASAPEASASVAAKGE